MEDTCRGKQCWFYILIKDLTSKQGNEQLDFKDCPFYSEMIFTPSPIGAKVETAKTIKDCSNKRSLLLLLQEVYPRLLGVQASNEEMRNSSDKASSVIGDFLKIASENIVNNRVQIDIKDNE
jgi:hypothetical protein